MTQSRKMSAVESLLNVAIGYGIAILTQIIVFPWFGIHIYAAENAEIGAVFTVVSLVRSYTLRRMFNWWHCRGISGRHILYSDALNPTGLYRMPKDGQHDYR